VRTLDPPTSPPILVADTVGCIERLPHPLLASFHSSLDKGARIVASPLRGDAADSERRRQFEVTRRTVVGIVAGTLPCIVVRNKREKARSCSSAGGRYSTELTLGTAASADRAGQDTRMRG
jgi:GTPase